MPCHRTYAGSHNYRPAALNVLCPTYQLTPTNSQVRRRRILDFAGVHCTLAVMAGQMAGVQGRTHTFTISPVLRNFSKTLLFFHNLFQLFPSLIYVFLSLLNSKSPTQNIHHPILFIIQQHFTKSIISNFIQSNNHHPSPTPQTHSKQVKLTYTILLHIIYQLLHKNFEFKH